jgi:predicted nucleic acid-binding protein
LIHYLDSRALVKLIKQEAESTALRNWMRGLDADDKFATSVLAELELTRSLTRHGLSKQEVIDEISGILDLVGVVKLSEVVLRTAIAYRIPKLGTLDSLHLATSELFRSELGSFVTYDKELAAAAEQQGLNVVAPAS